MKKLSKLDLESRMLSNEELITIKAGSGGGTCVLKKSNGEVVCGISMAEASGWANYYGSGNYWCCDSCASNGGSASYC